MSASAPQSGRHLERAMDDAAREFYRRLADGSPATTRCASCDVSYFPSRLRCPACGAATEWVELPRRGVLEAFTTQEAAIRFRAPEVLALARVGDVVVPGIAMASVEELAIGAEVDVEPFREPDTGLTLVGLRPVRR